MALWRYPVKSMQGESVDAVDVGLHGIVGDRGFGLYDPAADVVLTGRRDPKLLFATGHADGSVTLPDGTRTTNDGVLSDWIGRPINLRAATEGEAASYELDSDWENDSGAVLRWRGAQGAFHDSTRTQVSILSIDSTGDHDLRRFRANVIVDGGDERELLDKSVRIGDVVLSVVKGIDRCVMVTREQPDGIERDLDVLRAIQRDRENELGVGALVWQVGTVRGGDAVTLA